MAIPRLEPQLVANIGTREREAGAPRESAIAIRVSLPPDLERFRLAHVPNAAVGVPAHITLIDPFVPADLLGPALRRRVAAAVDLHAPFEFTLLGPHRWPDALYLPVDPVEPFEALVASLVVALPAHPPNGGTVAFVPHVTIAAGADLAKTHLDVAPVGARRQRVDRILLIAQGAAGQWRTRWKFPLGS